MNHIPSLLYGGRALLCFSCRIFNAVSISVLLTVSVSAQERKVKTFKRDFQLSLFPGISTNGTASGSYINKYSINLFGGISATNRYFEFSPLMNLEFQSTTGIQVAGLANIIGPNTFVNLTTKEERELVRAGYEVNQQGVQLSGVLNYVFNSGGGIQLSGVFNVIGNNFSGVQFAGIGNAANGYVMGLQAAGIFNIARESMAGWQVTSLFNYTDGALSGTQIALINKARIIYGGKSTPPTSARGLQLGLFNFCKSMDGLQIGLINFSGPMRGKQFGLINFFSTRAPMENVRSGTPIGLLNFGSKGSLTRVHFNELFNLNFEWTTGNCLNCTRILGSEMPFSDANQIFNQNALIVGFDTWKHTWGFGWGFQKVLYSKVTPAPSPENKKRVITYGIKFLHLNRSSGFDDSKNLVTRFNFDYGKRWRWIYVFGGVSFNYFLHETKDAANVYAIRSQTLNLGKAFGLASVVWPGYSLGIQF